MDSLQLKDILWKGITIQTSPTGILYLGLICDKRETCLLLLNILKNNRFKLKVETHNFEKRSRFIIDFEDLDDEIWYEPNNEEYIERLKTGECKHLTTGFIGDNGKILCIQNLIELNEFNFSLN